MSIVLSLIRAAVRNPKAIPMGERAFIRAWRSYNPRGEEIQTAPITESVPNLIFQGYHVTQECRVLEQIKEGRIKPAGNDVYFWPFLLSPLRKSPLALGGGGSGCWNTEDPVIIHLGSDEPPRWNNYYEYPYYPGDSEQDIKILGAWRVNPDWIELKRYQLEYAKSPLSEKLSFASLFATRVMESDLEE